MARTFVTLFSESALRIGLLTATDEEQFCSILEQRVQNLKSYNNIFRMNLPPGFAINNESNGDNSQSYNQHSKVRYDLAI